jgi:hypothetical protein
MEISLQQLKSNPRLESVFNDTEDLEKAVRIPYLIKNKILMSPGIWNNYYYKNNTIENAYSNTDWDSKEVVSLFLDHEDERSSEWVGWVKNPRLDGEDLRGDLVIVDKATAIKLYAGAKFGISPKVRGQEEDGEMKNFIFDNFSVVLNPAVKTAYINNAENDSEDSKKLKRTSEDFKKNMEENKMAEEEDKKEDKVEAETKDDEVEAKEEVKEEQPEKTENKEEVKEASMSDKIKEPISQLSEITGVEVSKIMGAVNSLLKKDKEDEEEDDKEDKDEEEKKKKPSEMKEMLNKMNEILKKLGEEKETSEKEEKKDEMSEKVKTLSEKLSKFEARLQEPSKLSMHMGAQSLQEKEDPDRGFLQSLQERRL